jgi:hypothetical protein
MKATHPLHKILAAACVALLAAACTLTDSAASISATPQISGTPVVRLASPLADEVYAAGAAVNILARVENAGEDIALLDILLDGQSIGSAAQPNESAAIAFTVTNSWVAANPGSHLITVRAQRSDGSFGEASASIQVLDVAGDTGSAQATPEPTPEETSAPQVAEPTATTGELIVAPPTREVPAPTAATAPTQAPSPQPPPASGSPAFTVISGANVRSGPGLAFNPPIGSLPAGATGEIIAISPDRQWYRVRYNNGQGSGWMSATTVNTTGDLASLPVDQGPPPPAPTATSAPAVPTATSAPAANIDLSITLLTSNPDPLVCNQAATITMTVVNTGSSQSQPTIVRVEDVYGGAVAAAAEVNVPPLGQNQSVDVSVVLTVSTNFAEQHTLRARVDPGNLNAETNEGNNEINKAYTLATGGC